MEAQANTTREQSNKKNIYDVGWRPSHGENGGVSKKKAFIFSKKNFSSHNVITSGDSKLGLQVSVYLNLTPALTRSATTSGKVLARSFLHPTPQGLLFLFYF